MDSESIAERSSTALLRCIPLFAGLPEPQLEQIARIAKLRKITRNTAIVHVGDEIDALYVIVSGSAKVLNRDSEGREVILSLLGAGECVGEMGLIDGSPRSADVVASESCVLLVIAKADFTQALADNVDLGLNIMKSLVLRLREANRKIESLALLDVYGRVAKLLFDMSEKENGVRIVKTKVSRQDMAKMVGASREMVSRVMRDLELSGYIHTTDGRMEIKGD